MSRTGWIAAALGVLAIAVYANAPANGFALDDEFIVLRNERVHGAEHLPDAITSPYWPESPARIAMYRPITVATYALEWELWGARPTGYHAVNVLLHAAVTVLLFALLLPLAGRAGAAVGAGLFALHPVHVEAVSNVVGRAELLAALFALLACIVYLRAPPTEVRGRRRWLPAGAIGLLYLLALGAKEIAVTLPALLVLLELVRPEGRAAVPAGAGDVRSRVGSAEDTAAGLGIARAAARALARWPVYAMTVAALVAYLAVRGDVLHTTVGNDPAPFLLGMSTRGRLLTAVSVWPEYLRLMLFPRELVSDYSPGVIQTVTSLGPPVILGLLTGVLLVAVAVWAWRRERLLTIGIAWGITALLPVSNLFFPIGVMLAERTLYLPSVGLAIAAAGVTRSLRIRRRSARVAVAAAVLGVAALATWRTWTRTPDWADTVKAMQVLARSHPESFRAQWLFANSLRRHGERERALDHYRLAVDLMPGQYPLRFEYGTGLVEAGRYQDAAEQFDVARRLVPEFSQPEVYRLGVLLELGRDEQAVREGRAALRRFPSNRGVYHQLAIALTRTGRFQEAARTRREALDLAGARANWKQWLHLAELETRLGHEGQAREALSNARERAPASASAPTFEELVRAVAANDATVLPYR